MIIGCIFYYLALKDGVDNTVNVNGGSRRKDIVMLLLGMALLLIGSNFTVSSAVALAQNMNISAILIGIMVVGVGTTIPEIFFAVKSIKKEDDSLAIGDILGTVLADATIVVGLIALISPFAFSPSSLF